MRGWQPDNRLTRTIWGYNGQLPGPTIRAKEGDNVVVRVKNNLKQPTSVHWHGMHQKGTWFMDGVEQVSQPRIGTGECFEYRFRAEPAGTHWYHSHTGVQYSEGLFGALIVDARDDPYLDQYQQEFVVMINDWFHEPADKILNTLKTVGYPDSGGGPDIGDVPFETALVNGKGRGLDASAKGPVEIFQVNEGVQTVRLRLINASSTYAFEFVVDDHAMELIAADGSPTFLTTGAGRARRLVLHIGERYDVLVDVPARKSNYWLWARTLEEDKDGNNLNHGVKAILRDASAAAEDPPVDAPLADPAPSYFDFTPPRAGLPPLATQYETQQLTLEGSMLKVDPVTKAVLQPYSWKVNNQEFEVPKTAIITPDLKFIPPKDPPTTQLSVPISDGFSLVILNKNGMNHPFHLALPGF